MKTLIQNKFLVMAVAFVLMVTAGTIMAMPAAPVEGASVTPIVIPGGTNTDKTCDVNEGDSQSWLEFKLEGASLTNGTHSNGTLTVTVANLTSTSFDWTSNIGVDAVIVKNGSAGANLYVYDPPAESTGDTNLSVPSVQAISHISFCYDLELDVTKTANGTFDRSITWELNKTVAPDSHSGGPGQTFDSTWTVEVIKNVVEENYEVTGTITIVNPAPFIVSFSVLDVIDGDSATVNCPSSSIPAGGSIECSYSADENDGIDGTEESNTATVTSDTQGVEGGSATADVDFTATVAGDESVTVDDNRDTEGQFPAEISKTTVFNYVETFECSDNPADYNDSQDSDIYPNTATVIGVNTNLSDDAEVTVECAVPSQADLVITKDAVTTFTRTFEWDINKSVTPETWNLFTGDSGTSAYDVTVTNTGSTDSAWAVTGSITIENPDENFFDAVIESIVDSVDGTGATVDCNGDPDFQGFPHALPPGELLVCTYSADLTDGTNRVNTVTVTTSGDLPGGGDQADVIFGDPTTEVNETVNVTDSVQGDLGACDTTTSPCQDVYTGTFTCDEDEDIHENTATIVETGDSDSASVTVNCYQLAVEKDAETTFTRTWDWNIDKSADQSDLLLSEGQIFTVNYDVMVGAASTDSDWAVAGTIIVTNNHPTQDAELTEVADIVSPDIAASVNCPSLTVPADGTLVCTYSADLPDDSDRTNTATATQQDFDYDSDGVGTPSGTTDYSGNAEATFGDPTTEVDECVEVSDTNDGVLGTVCAGDAPETFNYSLVFGAHPDADVVLVCGENDHPNTASFVANDTGATGEDNWNVHASVACEQGCTLTPGYWKTHSDQGPAPFDDTWLLLAAGSDTDFFLSEQSYYNVLWTAPKGNAYYILARAYIAAELNQLNGASIPNDVLSTFDEAKGLFATYTPAKIGALKGNKQPRAQFISLAGILDNYNNGITGPGHCSEDENSASNN